MDRLSDVGKLGLRLFEQMKAGLELDHLGEAVAIHVDTGDYALGKTHSLAARELLKRHAVDGRIATFTIGPPTDSDLLIAGRIAASRKL